MRTIIDPVGGIDPETKGNAMIGNGQQIDGGAGVENAIIETGETILTIEPQGSMGTLLTGVVVEKMAAGTSKQANQRVLRVARSVKYHVL